MRSLAILAILLAFLVLPRAADARKARRPKTLPPSATSPPNSGGTSAPTTATLTSPPRTQCPNAGDNRRALRVSKRALDGYQLGAVTARKQSDGSQTVVIPLYGSPITMNFKSTLSPTLDVITDVTVSTTTPQWIGLGLGSCMVGAYALVGHTGGANLFSIVSKSGSSGLIDQGALSTHGITKVSFATTGSGAVLKFTMTQSQLNLFSVPVGSGGISTMIFAVGGNGGNRRDLSAANIGEHNTAGVYAVQFLAGVNQATQSPTVPGFTLAPISSNKVVTQSVTLYIGSALCQMDVITTFDGVTTTNDITMTLNQPNSWIGIGVGSQMLGSNALVGIPGQGVILYSLTDKSTSATTEPVLTMDPGITKLSYATSGGSSVLKFFWSSANSPQFPLIPSGAPQQTNLILAYGGSSFGHHTAYGFGAVKFSV